MKLPVLLCLMFLLALVFSNVSYASDQLVTISTNNITVKGVVDNGRLPLVAEESYTRERNGLWQIPQRVDLRVTERELAKVDNKLISTNLTISEIPNFENDFFVERMRALNPDLIRLPHNRYYWQRVDNKSVWFPTWNSWDRIRITETHGNLFLDGPNAAVYQHIYNLDRIEFGQEYQAAFDYFGHNIHGDGSVKGMLVSLHFFEADPWWSGSVILGYADIEQNSGQGTASTRITMPTLDSNGQINGKSPAFVRIVLRLDHSGAVDINNIRLVNTRTNQNVIQDPFFRGTWFPPDGFQYRFTSGDMDRVFGFFDKIGARGLWQFSTVDAFRPNVSNPRNADDLKNAVLNDPRLNENIQRDLDALRYAKEKGYEIPYWEFHGEPEIWWIWISGDYNYGGDSTSMRQRYRLAGIIYAMVAEEVKKIDPNIKLVAPLYHRGFWKESVDGFFDGLNEARSMGITVHNPDLWAPHPYQLRSWGDTPACPQDEKICIDSLLRYAHSSGPARCDMGSYTIINGGNNIDYMSFYDAYHPCLVGYLKSKGDANPQFIFTEWEASGGTEVPYGRFGNELWYADRIGLFAEQGVYSSMFWRPSNVGRLNFYGNIDSPYISNALLAEVLRTPQMVLETESPVPSRRLTVYAFKEAGGDTLSLMIVNLDTKPGSVPVRIRLPNGYANAVVKEDKVTCEGEGCIYARKASRLNGKPVTSQNALDLLRDKGSGNFRVSGQGSILTEIPNSSVVFLRMER